MLSFLSRINPSFGRTYLNHSMAFWSQHTRISSHTDFGTMAIEVFGAAAGALSVAALLNNCVNCFEYT
jgi:hypothetical protein